MSIYGRRAFQAVFAFVKLTRVAAADDVGTDVCVQPVLSQVGEPGPLQARPYFELGRRRDYPARDDFYLGVEPLAEELMANMAEGPRMLRLIRVRPGSALVFVSLSRYPVSLSASYVVVRHVGIVELGNQPLDNVDLWMVLPFRRGQVDVVSLNVQRRERWIDNPGGHGKYRSRLLPER
ncbi:hypothetical protein DL95DRAFT_418725 [Leptodontidium sp. 2 PMI_412]|nr:hypothetical protein DL95DRAFT_418725 [Leptodontidium sp. 2 PMI_412]